MNFFFGKCCSLNNQVGPRWASPFFQSSRSQEYLVEKLKGVEALKRFWTLWRGSELVISSRLVLLTTFQLETILTCNMSGRPEDCKKKWPSILKSSPNSCQVTKRPKHLHQRSIWKSQTSASNQLKSSAKCHHFLGCFIFPRKYNELPNIVQMVKIWAISLTHTKLQTTQRRYFNWKFFYLFKLSLPICHYSLTVTNISHVYTLIASSKLWNFRKYYKINSLHLRIW